MVTPHEGWAARLTELGMYIALVRSFIFGKEVPGRAVSGQIDRLGLC